MVQCSIHNLTMAAQISWEVPWAAVPAQKKGMLFDVVSQFAFRENMI